MQPNPNAVEQPSLKLIYPDWVRQDKHRLIHLITNQQIDLTAPYQQMLTIALATNLLADPSTEYDILVRAWALGLMEQGFLILDHGLVDSGVYASLKHHQV
ncbi:hypothetical protein [Cardinium endosymbiont of Philonthus spinipes]|uniref:hypothetical protein n=1 Tax=Cardinium endosymbiont of Philonthus spinipes TaxID=3077941 RepID=UPI00313B9B35